MMKQKLKQNTKWILLVVVVLIVPIFAPSEPIVPYEPDYTPTPEELANAETRSPFFTLMTLVVVIVLIAACVSAWVNREKITEEEIV